MAHHKKRKQQPSSISLLLVAVILLFLLLAVTGTALLLDSTKNIAGKAITLPTSGIYGNPEQLTLPYLHIFNQTPEPYSYDIPLRVAYLGNTTLKPPVYYSVTPTAQQNSIHFGILENHALRDNGNHSTSIYDKQFLPSLTGNRFEKINYEYEWSYNRGWTDSGFFYVKSSVLYALT